MRRTSRRRTRPAPPSTPRRPKRRRTPKARWGGGGAGGEETPPAAARALARPEKAPDAKGVLVRRPTELLEAILAAGRKGLSIQRYKGLGEMNADQPGGTTLEPGNR